MTGVPPPPTLARRMLALALPADAREHVVDDLDEMYLRVCEQQGRARARRWYWRQALSFSAGLLLERLRERSAGRHPIAIPIQDKRGPMRASALTIASLRVSYYSSIRPLPILLDEPTAQVDIHLNQ